QKKLLSDSIATRFKELGPEPTIPAAGAPTEAPVAAPAPAGTSVIEQPIASVRTGEPVKPAASTPQAKPAGSDVGPAPPDAHEGRTGKLPDGTKVIVKGG